MIDVTLLRKHLDIKRFKYQYNFLRLTGLYQQYGLITEMKNKHFQYDNSRVEFISSLLNSHLLKMEKNPCSDNFSKIFDLFALHIILHLSNSALDYLNSLQPND